MQKSQQELAALAQEFGRKPSMADIAAEFGGVPSSAPDVSQRIPAKGISTEAEAMDEYSKKLAAWSPELLGLSFADLRNKAVDFGKGTLEGIKQLPEIGRKLISANPVEALGIAGGLVGGAVKGILSPVGKIADVIAGNETPESARNKLAGASVDFVTQTAPAIYGIAKGAGMNPKAPLVGEVKAVGPRLAAKAAPGAAERMTRYSKAGSGAVGKEQVDIHGRMETTLREAGTSPVGQRDANVFVLENLKKSNAAREAVVEATPKTTTIPKEYLRDAYQNVIDSLDPEKPGQAAARKDLEWVGKKIEAFPDRGNYHQTLELRQELDHDIAAGKGWSPAVKAEAEAFAAIKKIPNSLRDLLSEFAPDKPAWDAANESFRSWKTRAEIVERQQSEVLAAKNKGIDAQIEAAKGKTAFGDTGAVNAATAIGKAAVGMPRAAAADVGRILGRQRDWFDRAVAKGNEKLLDLSGKKYGDFVQPEARRPSFTGTSSPEMKLGLARGPYQPEKGVTLSPVQLERLAVNKGTFLPEHASPSRVEIAGEPVVAQGQAVDINRPDSTPGLLPMQDTRLNYGSGYGNRTSQNFQFSGENVTDPLRKPAGPGTLFTSDPKVIQNMLRSIGQALDEGQSPMIQQQLLEIQERLIQQLSPKGIK